MMSGEGKREIDHDDNTVSFPKVENLYLRISNGALIKPACLNNPPLLPLLLRLRR